MKGGGSVLTVFFWRVAGARHDYDLARKVHEARGGGGESPVGERAQKEVPFAMSSWWRYDTGASRVAYLPYTSYILNRGCSSLPGRMRGRQGAKTTEHR